MKPCGYCGAENNDAAVHCHGCGTELKQVVLSSEGELSSPVSASRDFIDLDALPGAFDFQHGFSRPDWELIWKHIQSRFETGDHVAAWTEAGHQWIEKLKQDLGGEYWITASQSFLMLSAVEAGIAARLLGFAERAHEIIRNNLRDLAWTSGGKEIILLFTEEDDYYEYIAAHYPEDQIPRSAGIHINSGYTHVGLTFRSESEACHTIVHELTHGCLQHLPVPLWLNEGVCETLRRLIGGPRIRSDEGNSSAYWTAVSGWRAPLMWDELAERHHAFWNEKNIQAFWAGSSFGGSQESQELSYSLAEVMVHLMSGDHEGFLSFLSRAHYDDAGQTAALDCLGMNLGDVIANFLGPGDWRPYRKAIVECWQRKDAGDERAADA